MKYQIQKLMDEGVDFAAIFPAKQEQLKEHTGFNFGLGEIAKLLKTQTKDFTIANPIAQDIDKYIYEIYTKWKASSGAPVPAQPTKADIQSAIETLELLGTDEANDAIETLRMVMDSATMEKGGGIPKKKEKAAYDKSGALILTADESARYDKLMGDYLNINNGNEKKAEKDTIADLKKEFPRLKNLLKGKTKISVKTADEKVKASMYHFGEYQEETELDMVDIPLTQLDSDQLLGFTIRPEDENKFFYADENYIDEDDDGTSVKYAYAFDKQYPVEEFAKGGRVKTIKESDIQIGKKFELNNGEVIEIKRLFKENIDEDWVEFTRDGKTQEGSVNSLKNFINNWRKEFAKGGSINWVASQKQKDYFTQGTDDGEKPLYHADEVKLYQAGYHIEADYRHQNTPERDATTLSELKEKFPDARMVVSESEFGTHHRFWVTEGVKYQLNRFLTNPEQQYLTEHGLDYDESGIESGDEENNILTLSCYSKPEPIEMVDAILMDAMGSKKEYQASVVKKMSLGGLTTAAVLTAVFFGALHEVGAQGYHQAHKRIVKRVKKLKVKKKAAKPSPKKKVKVVRKVVKKKVAQAA